MRILILLLCVVLSPSVLSGDLSSAFLREALVFQRSLSSSKQLFIYEGLPHQTMDQKLLAVEIDRDDTTRIWKYPFYTPALVASNTEILKDILGGSSAIKAHAGAKLCGGFHPDYCISWKSDGGTMCALICFGCGEIAFYSNRGALLYDLSSKTKGMLIEALKRYENKRPKSTKDEPLSSR